MKDTDRLRTRGGMSFQEQCCDGGLPGKTVFVTTSWDDGDRCDLRLAELLASRRLPATFYVATGGLGTGSTMSAAHLRELSNAGFEIGAHTVTHPVLTEVSASVATRELLDCKRTLENLLGREVPSFAYPKGRYNSAIVGLVREAGYRSARGVRMLSLSHDFPPFEMPVTIQAFPHAWTGYARNLFRRGEVATLARFSLQLGRTKNWVALGKSMFDRVLQHGGAWHLLGHSWQTEKLDGWSELEEILDYISARPGVRYVTNAELCQVEHPRMRTETGVVPQQKVSTH
jgi:peptidoglycan/xylan/chitin deacetylase (PgdA/CDA1 family)